MDSGGTPGRGTLYVVGTPIGNLSDITERALAALKRADRVVCEDTRRTLKLLNHYGIHKPLLAVFAAKEKSEVPKILNLLESGQSLALVTDAGTPGVSDPGSWIVSAARRNGFRVEPVPGVSAIACALSMCGFAQDGLVFLGFLPRSPNKIRRELARAAELGLALAFFESPFRVVKTLTLASEVLGPGASCLVAREMTKKFEEYLDGTLEEVLARLRGREFLGEATILLRKSV